MRNKIWNMDSFELLKEFKDSSVDLILTDPPYDFNSSQQIDIHNEMVRVCKGTIIVFSPPENQWVYPADQYLFWVKPISTKNTSRSYSRFVEMIFIYGKGTWNTGRHWSQYTNVFTDLVDSSKIHPYRKPPTLIRRLILNHSNKGDLVLDPFMGSGTTILECISTGRDWCGIEKEKKYFDIVLNELIMTENL